MPEYFDTIVCPVCDKEVRRVRSNQVTCLSEHCKAIWHHKTKTASKAEATAWMTERKTRFKGGRTKQIVKAEAEANKLHISYGEWMRRKEAGLL